METLGKYFVNSKMCSMIKLQHKHSPEPKFSERNFNTVLLGAEAHPAVAGLLLPGAQSRSTAGSENAIIPTSCWHDRLTCIADFMQQAFVFFIPGVQVFIPAAGQTDTFRGSSAFGRHVCSLN